MMCKRAQSIGVMNFSRNWSGEAMRILMKVYYILLYVVRFQYAALYVL